MSELDDDWAEVLAEAERRARAQGRGDLVEYLRLRASNDQARATGVGWLFETFTLLAGEANRAGAGVQISRQGGHRFEVGSATMVGTLLTLKSGVRQLMIEAGWPRAPRDGLVLGGGLASATVGHFGNARAGEELLLLPPQGDADPRWFVVEKTGARTEFQTERLRRHVARLLG